MARARSPELPDALLRARAHPLGRGTQRVCPLLHELRSPRQLPRYRTRVLAREVDARLLLVVALPPARLHRVRAALPRRTAQRRHARCVRHAIASCVAFAPSDLLPRHAGDDGLRGRRRSRIRHLPSPACLPTRHHRKHRRDHPLHDRLDPPTAPGRLGTRRRPPLRSDDRPARNTGPLGGSRVGDRAAGRAVADLWRSLVSVLSSGRRSTPRRRENADLREWAPTPIHLDPGGSGERTALLRLPVSITSRTTRWTRCSSSGPAPATTSPSLSPAARGMSTPSRSTRSCRSSVESATRTGRTRTRGSVCTWRTAARSSSGAIGSMTSSSSLFRTRSSSSRARDRSGSRASCSRGKPSNPCDPTSNPKACSPCTTTTVQTFSPDTRRRLRRSSARARASIWGSRELVPTIKRYSPSRPNRMSCGARRSGLLLRTSHARRPTTIRSPTPRGGDSRPSTSFRSFPCSSARRSRSDASDMWTWPTRADTSISSSWVRRSSCWRRRASCNSLSSSGRRGSSIHSSSPASCCPSFSPSRSRRG